MYNPMNYSELLPKIISAKDSKGITEREIAAAIGVSQGSVNKWLAGREPRPKALRKLLSLLGISEIAGTKDNDVSVMAERIRWLELQLAEARLQLAKAESQAASWEKQAQGLLAAGFTGARPAAFSPARSGQPAGISGQGRKGVGV